MKRNVMLNEVKHLYELLSQYGEMPPFGQYEMGFLKHAIL